MGNPMVAFFVARWWPDGGPCWAHAVARIFASKTHPSPTSLTCNSQNIFEIIIDLRYVKTHKYTCKVNLASFILTPTNTTTTSMSTLFVSSPVPTVSTVREAIGTLAGQAVVTNSRTAGGTIRPDEVMILLNRESDLMKCLPVLREYRVIVRGPLSLIVRAKA